MNGDKKDQPGGGMDRTVFVPSGTSLPPVPPAEPATPELETAEPVSPPLLSTPPQTSRPSAITESSIATGMVREIQIGDVLNHIFEVKRFIARGGMGEVFEGSNVNSDERVAIKVMLPSLAADPNVLAMFRKEARTLTRLSHPALVQYRVLAQEPQLGVFYIVTEFVDGNNLSDVITELKPTAQDLLKLLKRLAEGLNAAHALGAIHRDISPDNVMLEGGKLAGAKIIDFGIAKDLDPGSATIIGDGFAGKLNYVAPEQLGDFNRTIGPWTDVYSLGLLILAVALRKDVDMGGTLVNAVDKRRAGPDLTAAPEELRPLLERMVQANPADRPRSMGEVLELLKNPPKPSVPVADVKASQPAAEPPPAPPKAIVPPKATPPKAVKPVKQAKTGPGIGDWIKGHVPLVASGTGAIALLAAAGVYFSMPGSSVKGGKAGDTAGASNDGTGEDPIVATRTALNAGLPAVACTWLDVADVSRGAKGVQIALRGVAGKPADAQGQIARFLGSKNMKVSAIDFQDVSPIEATECGPMDALRQVRDVSGGRISVPQRQFEMSTLTSGDYAGSVGAKAVVNFNLTDPNVEVALFGLDPSGKISQLTSKKSELIGGSEDLGNNQYRLTIDINHAGWSGLLLLSGNKPIDGSLLAGPSGSRSGDWSQRFLTTAKEQNWRSEMVWFKTVDEQPN
jgi:eukaryotic-like serine/threonine-protein kinase